MSGLDDMRLRLAFYGGDNQQSRMNRDKLHGLRKSLLYSYQAQTIELSDSRRFRALINTDKLKGDYDNKSISIPFRDVCINSKPEAKEKKDNLGFEEIGLKTGDVFKWVENGTHWLVYLKYLEETAYFRADIRRCDQWVQVNDNKYWVYIRGPEETSLQWNQKKGIAWNQMNYSLEMYITKNDETDAFFHRFTKVKIHEGDKENYIDKTWQVVAVNPFYGDDIICIHLEEYYENSIQDAKDAEDKAKETTEEETTAEIYIDGPDTMDAFGGATYKIAGAADGHWYLYDLNNTEIDLDSTDSEIEIRDALGKPRKITIVYRRDGDTKDTEITKSIKVKPL